MNFLTQRASDRLRCARQAADNQELAMAYIGEAAALLDAAIQQNAWPRDVRAVLQEMVTVSRVLMEAWRPAQPDPAFDVMAFAVHDFNDES